MVRPWFQVLRDCLCCCTAHPDGPCSMTWCRCVKYIADEGEYPVGEMQAS